MSGVRVCETVEARTMAELVSRRDGATRADVVELRLDGVADADVAGALAGRTKPVIVTCRPAWDGGRFEGDERVRLDLLSRASILGAEYVDVEARAEWSGVTLGPATRRILSFHDWTGVPDDLTSRVADMRRSGSIVKVAVTARRLTDCLRLREACEADGATEQIAIAMGPAGQLTRACPWLVGSSWTYGGTAAPGQVAVDVLLDRFQVRTTGSRTAIYGVAGRPVRHSASPAMHNAAFQHVRADAVYVPLEGESAADVLDVVEAFGFSGLSVTAPFKQAMAEAAHTTDGLTTRLGAANTLKRSAAGWEARNFDVEGFLAPLDAMGWSLLCRRVLVLGAGGAARAVTAALVSRGAEVSLAARRHEQAADVVRAWGGAVVDLATAAEWDVVVNATPVGTWPHVDDRPVLPRLATGALAYDLVYNPPETAWLRDAAAAGATTVGGLSMLVEQACHQFSWWTGHVAPRDVMARAAHAFVTGEARTAR